MADVMAEAGWTLGDNPFFTFTPLHATIGRGELTEGVDRALEGCRVGDEVEIYCTSSVAYGKNLVETLPKNTPVYWHIIINGTE